MDLNPSDKVTAYDTMFTTNHIQMLKILLAYLPPASRGKLAVSIKFLELQYTLRLFGQFPQAGYFDTSPFYGPPETFPDALSICRELDPFCTPEEKSKMNQLQNFYQNWANLQETMQMFEMMKDLMPEGFGDPSSGMDISQMMEFMKNV